MEPLTIALTLLVGVALPLGWLAARRVRFTTLVAAVRWETFSLVAIGTVELLATWQSDHGQVAWAAPVRWAAASTVFCGWMARLGARRPHDAGWQLVVAALWAVLALPAAEVFFLQSGQTFEIHAARGLFLWLLIAGGLFNTLPTRAWLVGLLTAIGQLLLLAEHLPGLRFAPLATAAARDTAAIALAFLAAAQVCRACPGQTPETRPDLTGVWLDFRDQFGAWWGLRLMERVNAAATLGHWPVRLRWSGFEASPLVDAGAAPDTPGRGIAGGGDGLSSDEQTALRQTLWNVLRRFVTPAWIAGRLGQIPDNA